MDVQIPITVDFAQQRAEALKVEERGVRSIRLASELFSTGVSYVSSYLLVIAQDTSEPFLRSVLLFLLVLLWIETDKWIWCLLDKLPLVFYHILDYWQRITNFIYLSLVFLFANYLIKVAVDAWNASDLNVTEAVVASVILVLIAFAVLTLYMSWPIGGPMDKAAPLDEQETVVYSKYATMPLIDGTPPPPHAPPPEK